MAKSMTWATAIVAATGVLTLYSAAVAQTGSTGRTPTQIDFDVCNREAQLAQGGSAAPGPSTSGSGSLSSSVTPPAGGVSGGSASGVTGAAGATGGTGVLSDGSTIGGGGDATTSSTPVPGLAAAGANDPAFKQVFQSCLRRRGF
jgi:hypothetical protein